MDLTLIGVVVGAILILFLIRGVGFYFARTAARNAYREAMNTEVRTRNLRHHHTGASVLPYIANFVEPRRPEQVFLSGENRYERSPAMEAPPVYSKQDAPPKYVDATASQSSPQASSH
jgi:hypothetical protein